MSARAEGTAKALALLGAAGLLVLAAYVAHEPVASGRLEWRAIAPPMETPLHPWRWIVIHHSGTRSGDTASIDASHVRDRGWEGIGYHFVIGNGMPMPAGRVEATWRWKQQYHGAHAGAAPAQEPYNQDGIGICIIGDYDQQELDPLVEERLVQLCVLLILHDPGLSPARIIGHRDVPARATDCPGRNVDINRIRYQVREALRVQGVDRP